MKKSIIHPVSIGCHSTTPSRAMTTLCLFNLVVARPGVVLQHLTSFNIMLLFTALLAGGYGNNACAQKAQDNIGVKEETKTVLLTVTGTSCEGCPDKIHTTLSEKEGIVSNRVDNKRDVVWLKYNPSKITVKQIIKTIKKTGFKAKRKKEAKSPCCSNNVGGK